MTGTAESRELFRALELAHYAERFRERVFVIGLSDDARFPELLLDLKVLAGYRIQVVLVLPDPQFRLEALIQVSNRRGARFHLSLLTDHAFRPGEADPALDYERLRAMLAQGRTPVIAHHLAQEPAGPVPFGFALAARIAGRLGADKLFLVTAEAARLRPLAQRTHLLVEALPGLSETARREGAEALARLLPFVADRVLGGIPDVILLEGEQGQLFREVFTHNGAGVLVNRVRLSRIRQARIEDVTEIALLLAPEVARGAILPMDENALEANIDRYWVYEVDGVIVCSAGLKLYGEWAELAQFAAPPRYRGRGRARGLALALIDHARTLGLRRLFALSIDARMWGFFRSLGFAEVERTALPETWQAGYDLTRPSRAFLLEL
ncbi:MAG: GNAT family N-acetyltransferase [Candidatus Lambdaproteobacteria bacterium]|nr:GNAT family N-acetyltransferase [Candidatus Lambdaproteobacteria bacterium]